MRKQIKYKDHSHIFSYDHIYKVYIDLEGREYIKDYDWQDEPVFEYLDNIRYEDIPNL